MILALDTDVVVSWAMVGSPRYGVTRRFLQREVREQGQQLGITPQVLFEFIHICTDPRRFEKPLSMDEAINLTRTLWDGAEVARIVPGGGLLHRTLELLTTLRLGRKRILDTALAVTLEEAGVKRLSTFNRRDYKAFHFLEIVTPS